MRSVDVRVLGCNDLADAGVVGSTMSDTPTRRGLPPELDRIAHERRARLIAELHRQAIATANDLSAQRKAIRVSITKDDRRRKAEAWIFTAAAFILALGCIVAVSWLFGRP